MGNRLDEDRAAAFLRAAPEMVEFLEDNTAVKLRAYPYHPDYLATLDGATLFGRVLEPEPFDASVLGRRFADIRPPLQEFMLLSGMMVDRVDIGHLMNAKRKISSLSHTVGLLARYAHDRLRHGRGTRLVMGNALVGRLYHALLQRAVPVMLSTEVESIVQTGERVTGAVLRRTGETTEIRTRAGVVLATGGLSHHPELRRRLMPAALDNSSPVVDSATGDGLTLAEQGRGASRAGARQQRFLGAGVAPPKGGWLDSGLSAFRVGPRQTGNFRGRSRRPPFCQRGNHLPPVRRGAFR